MAITARHPDLLAALAALVGNPDTCRRVVIDINPGQPVIVHVERYGDLAVLDVIRALNPAGIQIREVSDGETVRAR